MLNRSVTLTALFLAFAAPAWAQPAVPMVPPQPLPGRPNGPPPSASDLPPTTAPGPAPMASAAPVAAPAPVSADAPPTTDFAPAPPAPRPVTAAAAPPSVSDAPPSASDAPPTSTPAPAPAGAIDAPPTTIAEDAAAPTAASLQTVPRNASLTPEGNAAFLAIYRARPDVVTLPSGVMYRALVTGKGTVTPLGRLDTVTVSYRGWLIDGTSFDSSPVGNPRAFQLAALIEGWREALMKMKVGDLWEVVIPAHLAYGAEGRAGRIPPNQTLIFVISLSKIEYAG